jgi:cytochrome P450
MWIMVLILTFLFASLHQTFVSCARDFKINANDIRATMMIWVTFHLGMRPDCQDSLREEISSILRARELNYASPTVDVQTMNDAVKTDSFIREALRMKGDIVNLLRAPIRDIEFGGYIIPKGSNHQL